MGPLSRGYGTHQCIILCRLSIYYSTIIITLHECARGTKQSVCLSVVIVIACCYHCHCWHKNHQISRSRYLCVLQVRPIGRYRSKFGLYALRIAQEGLLALQIVHLFSMSVVYRPHPLFWHMLMRLCILKAQCWKGSSRHKRAMLRSVAILCYSGYRACRVCALRSSSYY